MVSSREKIVRTLDNETKSIAESARDIAKILNLKFGNIYGILMAKRRGFNSRTDYNINNWKKRGFKNYVEYLNYHARKLGFSYYRKYYEHIVQKNGFMNHAEYMVYLRNKSKGKFRNKRDFQEREGLLEGLEYTDPTQLDNLASPKDYSLIGILEQEDRKEQITNLLNKALDKLKESWRKVIKGRFYEGKTLEEVGKELKISRERVGQIEEETLERLYYLAKKSGLYDIYIYN